MNWIIVIGLALYFVASGATSWRFGDGGTMNVRIAIDGDSFDIKSDGAIDLAPDGSGVTAVADGGYLDIRRRGSAGRRVRFEGEHGSVARQFFSGNDEQPWSPEADRFVAEVMPIVLRETGINADERVSWLLANRGQLGLLDEIDLIRSDFVQRIYTERYAQSTEIAPADFLRLMKIAETNMGSDFDLRTTLTSVYDAQLPTSDRLIALLDAGRSISSDFDARTLLEAVGPRMSAGEAAASAYLEVAATIGSDFDLRLALAPIVRQPGLADTFVVRALETAGEEIGSDFDLRTLLGEAATRVGHSDELARAFTTAANTIGGDFDHREALLTLANDADLTPAGWQMLLESARAIGGAFDCATLLVAVAPRLPGDADVIAAYRATLATIGGDFDRQRAAAAIERRAGP